MSSNLDKLKLEIAKQERFQQWLMDHQVDENASSFFRLYMAAERVLEGLRREVAKAEIEEMTA